MISKLKRELGALSLSTRLYIGWSCYLAWRSAQALRLHEPDRWVMAGLAISWVIITARYIYGDLRKT